MTPDNHLSAPNSKDELWTVAKVKEWSTGYLRQKGSPSPQLDSEILIATALGCRRIDLYTSLQKPLSNEEKASIRSYIHRRALGEPVAYIVGTRAFWRYDFKVSKDVLIPRPETELLLEVALDFLAKCKSDAPLKVLDIGTGSGCLAICLSMEREDLEVHAWEVSPPALHVAEENARNLGANVHFHRADALDIMQWCVAEQFDLIISNPPYIATHEVGLMDQSVLNFEPKKALFAEDNGYQFYQVFAEHAPKLLRPNGMLAVEVGLSQAGNVSDILINSGWSQIQVYNDLAGISRVVTAHHE